MHTGLSRTWPSSIKRSQQKHNSSRHTRTEKTILPIPSGRKQSFVCGVYRITEALGSVCLLFCIELVVGLSAKRCRICGTSSLCLLWKVDFRSLLFITMTTCMLRLTIVQHFTTIAPSTFALPRLAPTTLTEVPGLVPSSKEWFWTLPLSTRLESISHNLMKGSTRSKNA
eukprot:1223937-Amphidinium_carterae.1